MNFALNLMDLMQTVSDVALSVNHWCDVPF